MVLAATSIGLVLMELAARLLLNPADFLSVEMVSDPILGARPSPSTLANFDRWGFRNNEVPETVDIVAVGDSHTYGNGARMTEAWPAVLARLTSRSVYNMGLGGYGPSQYFNLSTTKAMSLRPHALIWGLYMGDDFQGNMDVWREVPSDRSMNGARVWLARHSLVYQLMVHAGIGARLVGDLEIRNAERWYAGETTTLLVPDQKIAEVFRPKAMLSRLDLNTARVREGMRIAFELLTQVNDLCRRQRVDFTVVVIPTKEMVFAEYLERDGTLALHDVVGRLLFNERRARGETFSFLSAHQIRAVDPLPALRKAVEQGLYVRSATDLHPNRNGYRVIAETVAASMR